MLAGEVVVGLDDAQLKHLATADNVAKLSVRDLAVAATLRADGATTVASTATLAARAGITIFATGGLGGVHRGASESYDESADLVALGRTPSSSCAPASSPFWTSARRWSGWRPSE
jgi:pseudouridine-5'-phosphate glycosidase